MSAGSKPTGQVHPRSLALLAREGMSTKGYHSDSWDNLSLTPEYRHHRAGSTRMLGVAHLRELSGSAATAEAGVGAL